MCPQILFGLEPIYVDAEQSQEHVGRPQEGQAFPDNSDTSPQRPRKHHIAFTLYGARQLWTPNPESIPLAERASRKPHAPTPSTSPMKAATIQQNPGILNRAAPDSWSDQLQAAGV